MVHLKTRKDRANLIELCIQDNINDKEIMAARTDIKKTSESGSGIL
jgi:hypothetical protein